MNLPEYYRKTLLRRILCHILPMGVAVAIGASAIMASDREDPVSVVWGKVIPPVVEPGQTVTFHYGSIKHIDYGGHITRWIVDSKGVVFHLTDTEAVGNANTEIGKEAEIIKDFPVPCGIGVGLATYHSEAALYKWWNVAQWIFPIKRHINYEFSVKQGPHNFACGFTGDIGSGAQGLQGIQGEPGKTGPAGGAQGIPGVKGATGMDAVRPRVVNKIWVEPTTVLSGGSFAVHINATINQVCPGETHWSIVRSADNVEIVRTIQATHPVKLGVNDITITRTVPPATPPGDYYYVVTVYEFCGSERTTYTAVTPHVPFTVK